MLLQRMAVSIISMVVILVGLCAGGRWIVFWQIERALEAKVENLRDLGVTLEYKNLDVNAMDGSLHVSEIAARWQGKDSIRHSSAIISRLLVQGVHLIPLLLEHKLVVDSVVAVNPQIIWEGRRAQHTGQSPGGGFLKDIEVQWLQIDSGAITLINDQGASQLFAELGVSLEHVVVRGLDHDSITWSVGTAATKAIAISLPTEFYTFGVQKFFYSRAEQFIRLDSIRMDPTLGHLAFAQQAGRQIDRIQCKIPRIDMHGVRVSESLPVNLAIHQIDLGFMLDVYRDLRFPSSNREPTLLPAGFMHQMPFSLTVDTLLLSNSSVTYEEVPHTGGTPGKIGFQAIKGGISNITTDSLGESTMQVSARFMNAGDLDAFFTFPMTRGKSNTIQATLSNFSMLSINSMLLPLVNLEVQSGTLQSLQMSFKYNEYESTGALDMRYTDLHVRSIHQNQKHSTNRLATLLINTMVQNNMDRSDMKAKRSGKIYWKRNTQASLPSYWWKSVLSGLRSVYRLENVIRI